ncbi:acyltransferase [Edaphobacter sp. 12200R-103]|uniref:acyltransferase family protein n=1 Tax=Edaphobacter sp. 12200R-103 TaxID=2703788 RepID=UPI00138D1B41|nr:acyltransferase [Edaphobacter sp. 12200R-103]QHS51851.1 acyltransferase [Edaphobacter sp. 12200R-103]
MYIKASERTGKASSEPRGGRQIVFLDLIRFTAALLVLAFHVGFRSFPKTPEGWHTVIGRYARLGWVGVPIFFVLSGFVIAYSAGKASPSEFVKSRLLRLYPAVWICSTITLVLQIFTTGYYHGLLHAWLDALTLAPVGPIIDGSYWTLRVEMSFYLLIFLLLVFDRFRYIGPTMVTVSALSTAFLALGYAVDHALLKAGGFIPSIPDFLINSRWARLLLIDYAPHFAIGVLLWLMFFHGVTIFRSCALAFCFLGAVLSVRVEWQEVVQSSKEPSSLMLCILIWAAAVLAIVLSVRYNKAIVEWLGPERTKQARTLGLITYPLYLLHQSIGEHFVQRLNGRIPDIAIMLLAAAASMALAYGVVRYAEKPIQERLRRLLHPVRPPVSVSTLP